MYRYVCPHCLRTFVTVDYTEEWFCWKCGQGLEVIPKDKGHFREIFEEVNKGFKNLMKNLADS